jgi:2-polyprenyl-3-methyl-5-hydroxy-6-metoxy-1,4-benzoquinol methylase
MAAWVADVRAHFIVEAPEMASLFDMYAAEALFGRHYIEKDLRRLGLGARVLEVGAGSFLLCCQLVREGFAVTGLEPTESGFSHFDQMRRVVLTRAAVWGLAPRVWSFSAEFLAESECFDYAFSVNVMEHVNDVQLVLEKVCESLGAGGAYRFTCPNYLFPYEPHFNIPTAGSKRLTEIVFGASIIGSQTVPDPVGTWKSLNWINVIQIKNIVKRIPGLQITFNHRLLTSTLERLIHDQDFANRRSPWLRKTLGLLVRSKLHHLLRFIPAALQPIIDCEVRKNF